MGKLGVVLFAACVIVGLYLLNSTLDIIPLPPVITGAIDIPLKIIGGVLVIVGGFLMIKFGKKKDSISA